MDLLKSRDRRQLDAVLDGLWDKVLAAASSPSHETEADIEASCAEARQLIDRVRHTEGVGTVETAIHTAVEAAGSDIGTLSRAVGDGVDRQYRDLLRGLLDPPRIVNHESPEIAAYPTSTDAMPAGPVPSGTTTSSAGEQADETKTAVVEC
jgi:hypothetical protein